MEPPSPAAGTRHGRRCFVDAGTALADFAGPALDAAACERFTRGARLFLRHAPPACPPPAAWAPALVLQEHVRLFVAHARALVVALDGVCTARSCPAMQVGERWRFLCSSHAEPRACCAIDYMKHVLTRSSLVLAALAPDDTATARTLALRLLRLPAHAHAHHAPVFAAFEGATHATERLSRALVALGLAAPDELLVRLPAAGGE